MEHDVLIKLCKFYKQENECPTEFDGKLEGKLWTFEYFLCKDILLGYELQEGESPREVFDEYVGMMAGKWCPYQHIELMDLYMSI